MKLSPGLKPTRFHSIIIFLILLLISVRNVQTNVEVPAPQAGVITALLVKDGDKVTAKQVLQ